MKHSKKITIFTFLLLLTACVPPQKVTTETKVGPAKPVTVQVLEITPLKQTKLSQKKSNVTIRIEPINDFGFQWYYAEEFTRQPEKIKLFSLQIDDRQANYLKKRVPSLERINKLVRFKITISNQSNTVIRPLGSILTIDADGKNIPVNSAYMGDYLTAIVVPNSVKEIIVSPFAVDTLIPKGEGTIRVGLYEFRVGNNVETFEWYYHFKTISKKVKGVPTITSEVRIYPFQAVSKKVKGPIAEFLD